MAYGTRIEEVEQTTSSRNKVMKAFGYTVCALAVVACLLVATSSQVSSVDVLEEQFAEFSVLNAPAKPAGKAVAAHASSSSHHASASHASASHASASHASASHASASHASASHASADHASASHAAPKAAGVKSATTTTPAAPVQAHPSSAAAVFLSTVAVACTVFLAL